MRNFSSMQSNSYPEANTLPQDMASFKVEETLALLKILALGNQEMAAGKFKPVASVVARLRARRAPFY